MASQIRNEFFETKVLGHPAGLMVLFFTEMWERFSFYGMRVLLVNFLTMAAISYNPGWEWSAENASALFGTYAGLLYLTPILGGMIADKYIGYRWAVVIGSIIMTLGHASMAMETELSLYMGLALLVIGTGFFKPNMTSIISEMYKDLPEKKDGAYTIFYMGVNAGAFFGMMLCGYLAERIGWSWGFGLAGIFMLLGTLQFWLAKPLFGEIGEIPSKIQKEELTVDKNDVEDAGKDKRNPFTLVDKILIMISAIIGLGYLINDPLSKIGDFDLFPFKVGGLAGQYVTVIAGLIIFLGLIISRIIRYDRIVRDRMIAFIIFAFFTVFFWMSFEQGASSLVIFARDNVNRSMQGNAAIAYNVINILLTVTPLLIITYVLYLLSKQTFKKIPNSNIILIICFTGVWGIVLWMLNRDFNTIAYNVDYKSIRTNISPESYNIDSGRYDLFKDKIIAGNFTALNKAKDNKTMNVTIDSIMVNGSFLKIQQSKKYNKKEKKAEQKKFNAAYIESIAKIDNTSKAIVYYQKGKDVKTIPLDELFFETPITEQTKLNDKYTIVTKTTSVAEPIQLKVGDKVQIITKDNEGESYGYLTTERLTFARDNGEKQNRDNGVINAAVSKVKENEVEIPVSWFSILNSFFIIAFASFFSRWWESKYNPSAASKYALGLIIMAIGFGFLAWGSYDLTKGIKVSMIWLVIAYLFHTLGELCLSPVGLSYVSKLVPPRMIAFMFGMWYLAIAIGNKLAAVLGGQIENITKEYSLSTFFLIFTIVPSLAGILILFLNPLLKKLMHGVK